MGWLGDRSVFAGLTHCADIGWVSLMFWNKSFKWTNHSQTNQGLRQFSDLSSTQPTFL